VEAFSDLIRDELNVKNVRLLDTSVEVVSHALKPLPKQLGQKYGNAFPAIREAILRADSEAGARSLLGGHAIRVQVEHPMKSFPTRWNRAQARQDSLWRRCFYVAALPAGSGTAGKVWREMVRRCRNSARLQT
jgi:hypothetical protein